MFTSTIFTLLQELIIIYKWYRCVYKCNIYIVTGAVFTLLQELIIIYKWYKCVLTVQCL